jgi:hypothetical protein
MDDKDGAPMPKLPYHPRNRITVWVCARSAARDGEVGICASSATPAERCRDCGLDAVDNKIIAQEADSIPQSELGRNGSVLRAVYELGVPAAVEETMKRPVVSEPGAADWHS